MAKVATTWMSSFPLTVPQPVPEAGPMTRRMSAVQWSYYENVCTFSYSQVCAHALCAATNLSTQTQEQATTHKYLYTIVEITGRFAHT